MRNRNLTLLALMWSASVGWALLPPRAACARDLAVIVDEHGHKVYINAGGPGKSAFGWRAFSFRPLGSSTPTGALYDVALLVEQAANRFEVDPDLVHAIIQVESEYNPHAVSRTGAMGLMQLMPETARRLGVQDAFDPRENIRGGVNHLRYLLDRFGGDIPLSLAAYNAGVNSVIRYGGVPSISETRDYVRRVTRIYRSDPTLDVSSHWRKDPPKAPIRRYVDASGVIHISNVD